MDVIIQVCPKCKTQISPNTNFCPNCGTNIAALLRPISIGRQIYQYVIAVLFPPFGLVWSFKYFRSYSTQQKVVGWVIVGLTAISLILTIWFVNNMIQSINQQLSTYTLPGY